MSRNVLSYARPTMNRRGVGSRLIIWLAQSFDRPTWRLAYACPVLVIWGSGMPGWTAPSLCFGLFLWFFYLVGLAVAVLASRWVRQKAIPLPTLLNEPRKIRRLCFLLLLTMCILPLRPMLYVNFWISKPWLDRRAAAVLSQPFSVPAKGPDEKRPYAGLFKLTNIRRNPQGVALFTHGGSYDQGSGFFYRDQPGNCLRFNLGRYLGGNWYSFDNDVP